MGLGVNVLAAHGDIKAITVTERLHEPINGGAGFIGFRSQFRQYYVRTRLKSFERQSGLAWQCSSLSVVDRIIT